MKVKIESTYSGEENMLGSNMDPVTTIIDG